MSRFPLPPELASALLKSEELGCSEELLTIAAMLEEEESLFSTPEAATRLESRKRTPSYSPIDLLKLHWSWRRVVRHPTKSQGWALARGVCLVGMRRVDLSRLQLRRICTEVEIPLASCRGDLTLVQRALCFGFIQNVAKQSSKSKYRLMATDYATVGFCPSAAPWIVFTDALRSGNRLYLHNCTPIEPDWMVQLAPHLVVKGPLRENDVNLQVCYQSENRGPVNKKEVPKEGVPVIKKDVPKKRAPVKKKDVPREAAPVNKKDVPKEAAPVKKKDVPKEAAAVQKDVPKKYVSKKYVPKKGVPIDKKDVPKEEGCPKKRGEGVVPKEGVLPSTRRMSQRKGSHKQGCPKGRGSRQQDGCPKGREDSCKKQHQETCS
ncbi:MAG: uncharacterized protein KVP18_001139 [Porospora cf. gigantea A]|uniref:uncharacterized protein n=1 Tax=Porospora cf. gigantea A TaxID=2853593 RepID=UPI0035595159|nr:MAG: hypothetical protein KVP18_001139 [Porospora cf. gigantea A]